MQSQLTDSDIAIYICIEEAAKIKNIIEIKMRTQALTFYLISCFHLIAGFKAVLRAGLKEGQLTALSLIKAEAMQIELNIEESNKKLAISTNGNIEPVLINQINEEDQNHIEAIKRNGTDPRIMVSPSSNNNNTNQTEMGP